MEKTINKDKSLREIQQEFALSKDNKAQFKYSNLNTVLTKLKELKANYSLSYLSCSDVNVSILPEGKDKFMWEALTKWSFVFNDKETIIDMYAIGKNTDPAMAMGSAFSYARRYLLMNLFNANDGGEFDPEQKKETTTPPTPKKALERQGAEAKLKDLQTPDDEFHGVFEQKEDDNFDDFL